MRIFVTIMGLIVQFYETGSIHLQFWRKIQGFIFVMRVVGRLMFSAMGYVGFM
jgi:hypothetical protein